MGFLGSLFFPSVVGYNDKKDPKNEVATRPHSCMWMSFCQISFFQIMGVLIQLSHNKNFLAYLNATVNFDQPWQQQKCLSEMSNSWLSKTKILNLQHTYFLILTLCCQTWSLLLIVIDFIRNNHESPTEIMQVMTPYKLRWANPYLIYVVPLLH